MRATAALGRHPHAQQAAPFDRHQGCTGSLHPAKPELLAPANRDRAHPGHMSTGYNVKR
jgi:hypothetical protein